MWKLCCRPHAFAPVTAYPFHSPWRRMLFQFMHEKSAVRGAVACARPHGKGQPPPVRGGRPLFGSTLSPATACQPTCSLLQPLHQLGRISVTLTTCGSPVTPRTLELGVQDRWPLSLPGSALRAVCCSRDWGASMGVPPHGTVRA